MGRRSDEVAGIRRGRGHSRSRVVVYLLLVLIIAVLFFTLGYLLARALI